MNPNGHLEVPRQKISQRDLIDARNAERVGYPAWLKVFRGVHAAGSPNSALEDGDYTVNWPWFPGIDFVTHQKDKLDMTELRERAKSFYRDQVARIEMAERLEAESQQARSLHERQLDSWRARRNQAREQRDWSDLLGMLGDRIKIAKSITLLRAVEFLSRHNFTGAAARLHQTIKV